MNMKNVVKDLGLTLALCHSLWVLLICIPSFQRSRTLESEAVWNSLTKTKGINILRSQINIIKKTLQQTLPVTSCLFGVLFLL